MKKHPLSVIATGECINKWDEFHADNYSWALNCIIKYIGDFKEARKLIDGIFVELTFSNPEIIRNNDRKALRRRISIKLAGIIAKTKHQKLHKKYKEIELTLI